MKNLKHGKNTSRDLGRNTNESGYVYGLKSTLNDDLDPKSLKMPKKQVSPPKLRSKSSVLETHNSYSVFQKTTESRKFEQVKVKPNLPHNVGRLTLFI